MALQANAKLANIEGSLRQYVNSTLGATFSSGAAIDWGGGEPFLDTDYAEWLQMRLLDPARPDHLIGPRSAGGFYAREMFHMLALNIFVRPAKLATFNSLRLHTLRDTVVGVFTPLTAIPVLDYAGSSAALGHLVVDAFDADHAISSGVRVGPDGGEVREVELQQWTLTVALRWVEEWS